MAAWYQEHPKSNKQGNKAGAPAGVSRPRGGQHSELPPSDGLFFWIFFLFVFLPLRISVASGVGGWGVFHAKPAPLSPTDHSNRVLSSLLETLDPPEEAARGTGAFIIPTPRLPSSSSSSFFFFSLLLFLYNFTKATLLSKMFLKAMTRAPDL